MSAHREVPMSLDTRGTPRPGQQALLPAASRPGGPPPSTPPTRPRGGHDPATAHLPPTFSHRVPNAELRSRVPSGCAVRIAAADALLTSSPSGPLAHAFSTSAGDLGAARRHDPERAARTRCGKPQPRGRSALHLHHWPAGAHNIPLCAAPSAKSSRSKVDHNGGYAQFAATRSVTIRDRCLNALSLAGDRDQPRMAVAGRPGCERRRASPPRASFLPGAVRQRAHADHDR